MRPGIIAIIIILVVMALPVGCVYFFTRNVWFTFSIAACVVYVFAAGLGRAFEAGFTSTNLLNTLNEQYKNKRCGDATDEKPNNTPS